MKITSTAHLSKEEIENIVTEHLKSKGFTVESFSFRMTTRCTGYGIMERDELVFDGADFKTTIEK